MDAIRDFFKKIVDYFKGLDKGQRSRLILLSIIGVSVIVAASVLMSQKEYQVLYTNISPQEAGEVLAQLGEMGVDAKAEGTSTILVEASVADEARMQLAGMGFPKEGLNYDLINSINGLTMTDAEKRNYAQYQLQEWITDTISAADAISGASVIINLGETGTFVFDDTIDAQAMVQVALSPGYTLTASEVKAIYELIRTSVPGIEYDNISVTDYQLNSYSPPGDADVVYSGTQLAYQNQVRDGLQKQVLNLLYPVFGLDGVRAEVNVVMNFDEETVEEVIFNPPVPDSETGLPVSIKQLYEGVRTGADGDITGFDPNGNLSQYMQTNGLPEDAYYEQKSQEINYELNETRKLIERAQGAIEQMSVSVLVNSEEDIGDYTEQVKNLVSNAIGVAANYISVEMLPFLTNDSEPPIGVAAPGLSEELLKYIILGSSAFLVMLILLMIVKTLLPKRQEEYLGEGAIAIEGETEGYAGVDYLADDGQEAPRKTLEEAEFLKGTDEDSSLTDLGKYIEKSPEAVAQLLRNWLSDESR